MVAVSVVCLYGCSACEDTQTQKRMVEGNTTQLINEYSLAVNQAERNESSGFIKIYKIASESNSAEVEEIARDKLHHLLYNKTQLWIKTFAAGDLMGFKEYLKNGGMAVLTLPEGVATQEQYENEIVIKLRKFKGNKREMELVEYILQLYSNSQNHK